MFRSSAVPRRLPCFRSPARGASVIGWAAVAIWLGCTDASSDMEGERFVWNVPDGVSEPDVPADNPMSEAKVQLGRHLFYDERLSGNQTQACGSCHQQALAFTDGLARAVGSTGQLHTRSTMSLANVAYAESLTWANPVLLNLERHALVPLFGERPVELGLSGQDEQLVERLAMHPAYPTMFEAAFPERGGEISIATITRALAAFQRTVLSTNSAYDRHLQGIPGALSETAQRGMELFFSERLRCAHCHRGFFFSDATGDPTTDVEREPSATPDGRPFHNTGLYNLGARGGYPEGNAGLYAFTGDPKDIGRFKTPTLRNIAVTAPYMHDGSIEALEGVVSHYAAGGRTILDGPHAGVGHLNPNKSELVSGFEITPEETRDLIAFLRSLTDEDLLTDPQLAAPR